MMFTRYVYQTYNKGEALSVNFLGQFCDVIP